jgi:hypothetical protein
MWSKTVFAEDGRSARLELIDLEASEVSIWNVNGEIIVNQVTEH